MDRHTPTMRTPPSPSGEKSTEPSGPGLKYQPILKHHRWVRHRRVPVDPDRPMNRRSFPSIATRASLLARVKDVGNHESWREFYDIYRRLVYSVARRAGLTEPEAQDAVQETFCHVAKNMPSFQYDPNVGSFKSWLLHTTRWHIADQFRARVKDCEPLDNPKTKSGTHRTSTAERIPDPRSAEVDEIYEAEWKHNLHDAALERVKRRVKPKQYQAYFLYVTKGVAMEEIISRLGVTRNQVYLAKHRIGKLVSQEITRLEQDLV